MSEIRSPRFAGFTVTKIDQKPRNVIFNKYTFKDTTSGYVPTGITLGLLTNWMPDFNAQCSIEALQHTDQAVETPVGKNWHSKMAGLLASLRFDPLGPKPKEEDDALVNVSNLEDYIFEEDDDNSWQVVDWKLIKKTKAELIALYKSDAVFDPANPIKAGQEIICDVVTWQHLTDAHKTFFILYGWTAYKS